MINVECPSCSASYPLDERRLPSGGSKMRCPKCGASFRVLPTGDTELGAPAAATGRPAPAGPRPPSPTAPDVDLPAPKRAPQPAAGAFGGLGGHVDLPAPKVAGGSPSFDDVDQIAGGPVARSPSLADPLEVDLPAPRAPAGARPKPPPPPGAPAGSGPLVDLPAPKHVATPPWKAGAAASSDDVDLPVHKPSPAPAWQRPKSEASGDVDLPMPKPPSPPPWKPAPPAKAGPASDLPAVKGIGAPPSFDDLDLSVPAPAAFDGLDLPVPKRIGGSGEVDLPVHKSKGTLVGVGLPAPKPAVPGGRAKGPPAPPDLDLPLLEGSRGFDEAALPAPKPAAPPAARPAAPKAPQPSPPRPAPRRPALDELDLPIPKGALADLDLPVPKGMENLPSLKGDIGFDDLDLPLPKSQVDLPQPRTGAAFDDLGLDLPVPRGAENLPVARRDAEIVDVPLAVSEANLPQPSTGQARPLGDFSDELELPEPPAAVTADGRRGAGGVGFGEIDFGETAPSDDMEFDEIPQERESSAGVQSAPAEIGVAAAAAAQDRLARAREKALAGKIAHRAPTVRRRKGSFLYVLGGVLVLVVLAGVGLGFTAHGFFGVYTIEQWLPAAGDDATATRIIGEAETAGKPDTYETVRASLHTLAAGRRRFGLNRRLLSRSLLHESLCRLRFGDEAANSARAEAIISRLDQRDRQAPGVDLAFAAHELAAGHLPDARRFLDQARAESGRDPYWHVVAGELALAEGRSPDDARAAFESSVAATGARGLWGVARSIALTGDSAELDAAVERVLEASPHHAEALTAKARLAWAAGEAVTAVAFARLAAGQVRVDDGYLHPSGQARAAAFTLLGRIYEQQGDRARARGAYEAAISAAAFEVDALLGAGRVLFEDGRFRDAMARFETVIQGGGELPPTEGERPPLVEARLGSARCMLRLDRVQDGAALLESLAAERPEDGAILLWLGRAEETLGQNTPAEQHYRDAIRLAPTAFDAYLALAQLFFASDRSSDAVAVLAEAERQVPETASMRRMMGEAELSRSEVRPALAHFRRALELDPSDIGARYGLGDSLRRAGRLDDAARELDDVARRDPTWAGLALARGMVFEALGRSGDAVMMYARALEERPDDPDLLLRLGAAHVASGQLDEAEQILQRVMAARPNSAEAEYFMGRVAFARGDLPAALTHFSRAVSLDSTQGEYELYLAWASLELNNLGRAREAIANAIHSDPSLADAYWIRGRLRVRTGEVRDALDDLAHALELKPGRTEAYADMGEAYDQLRRVADAIRAYERAVERDADRGLWWYRLGRLRMDDGRSGEAATALTRATLLGEAMDPRPGWLADAHRILGDAERRGSARQSAIQHYRRFLELAPSTAIDREDVTRQLRELGEDMQR